MFFFHEYFTCLRHLCPDSSLTQEEGLCCLWDLQLCTNTCVLLSFLLIDVLLLSLPFAQVHCSHSLCFPLLNPTLQITASCPSFAFYLPTPSCGGGVFTNEPFSLLPRQRALPRGGPCSICKLLGFHFRSNWRHRGFSAFKPSFFETLSTRFQLSMKGIPLNWWVKPEARLVLVYFLKFGFVCLSLPFDLEMNAVSSFHPCSSTSHLLHPREI